MIEVLAFACLLLLWNPGVDLQQAWGWDSKDTKIMVKIAEIILLVLRVPKTSLQKHGLTLSGCHFRRVLCGARGSFKSSQIVFLATWCFSPGPQIFQVYGYQFVFWLWESWLAKRHKHFVFGYVPPIDSKWYMEEAFSPAKTTNYRNSLCRFMQDYPPLIFICPYIYITGIWIFCMSTWCYTLFFPDACVSIPSPKGHFVGCDAWTPGWLGPLDGGEMFYMGDHF